MERTTVNMVQGRDGVWRACNPCVIDARELVVMACELVVFALCVAMPVIVVSLVMPW